MTPQELKKVLEDHRKWRFGKGGKRADLRGADLCGAQWTAGAICLTPPISITGGSYAVMCYGSHMSIGCKTLTYEEWESVSDKEIIEMDGNPEEWNLRKEALLSFRDPEAEIAFAEKSK